MAAGVCTLIYFARCRPKNASLKENYSDSSFRLDLEGSKFHFDVPIFSNGELEEATNNFSNSNRIGDGGFGTVYYGKNICVNIFAKRSKTTKSIGKKVISYN